MNALLQTMLELKPVEINADSEYAKSFGIEKGDTVFLKGFRFAEHGDLFLVEINGLHQLDTYDETYTDLEQHHSIGVLVGCLKTFKASSEPALEADNILDAEFLEVS